jgi:hypothetical protein
LVSDDLSEIFDAEFREGERFKGVEIVDPEHPVFWLKLVRQIPQQLFIASENLGGTTDGEHVGDSSHRSGGGLQIQLLPIPRQQLGKPTLREIGNSAEHIGEPSKRIDVVELGSLCR